MFSKVVLGVIMNRKKLLIKLPYIIISVFFLMLFLCAKVNTVNAMENDIHLNYWIAQDKNDLLKETVKLDYKSYYQSHFKLLTRDIGLAISPKHLETAATKGISGFEMALEYSLVDINQTAKQWINVTENPKTNPLLMTSHLHVRKGLPLSFEVGTIFSYVVLSQMYAIGGEIKWAMNEGFTLIPDASIKFSVARLFGSKDFGVTVGGFDIIVSKNFNIGSFHLAPFAAYNLQAIDATSSVIDPTPWNPYDYGDEENPTTNNNPKYTCSDTNPCRVDFAFEQVRFADNMYHRGALGIKLRSYIFTFVTSGVFSSVGVNTYNFKLGLDF